MGIGDWFFLMCTVGLISGTVQNCLRDYWNYKNNKLKEKNDNK